MTNFSHDHNAARPRLSKALSVAIGLTALFFVVYPTCNWVASQRRDVPTMFFAWERSIPFIPVMIVPYMSIDLFFVVAPFVCATNSELGTFARRLVVAMFLAAACFLAFPLQFAFPRPEPAGTLGAVFAWFNRVDRPFNLFPSLHIAFSTLLLATFYKHSRGALRVIVTLWFTFIVASAVLTYQHHLFDVAGGFALAGVCFYFVREKAQPSIRADVTAISAED